MPLMKPNLLQESQYIYKASNRKQGNNDSAFPKPLHGAFFQNINLPIKIFSLSFKMISFFLPNPCQESFWTDSTKALWGLSANKFLSVYVKRNCLPTQTLIKNWTICSQCLLGDIPAPTGIPIWETEPSHHTFIYQHKQRLSEQTLWYHAQRISNTFSYPLQTGMEYF